MRLHGIVVAIAALLFATMASAQSPSKANAVWGVNEQNEVFRWDGLRNAFVRMPGSLKQVAVGADGEVWGIDPDGNVQRWLNAQWQSVPGNLRQLAVRNAQDAWGVNDANALSRWTGSAWEPVEEDSHPVLPAAYVAAGADGTVWGIAPGDGGIVTISAWLESRTLYPLQNPGSGHLKRISVTDGNRAWAIDDSAQLFRWTEPDWQHVDGDYLDVVQAANGELWRLAGDGTVLFSQDPAAPAQPMQAGLRLKQIAVGAARAPDSAIAAEEQRQIVDAHNTERLTHPDVGALQWSAELASWAQEWVQTVVAAQDLMVHREDQRGNPFKPGEGLGENIYGWGPSSAKTGVDAVQSWIAEKQWYDYEQDHCAAGKVCGHYTQVVWKNHQYVGCGKAISARDLVYYVCNYYPAGNTGGRPY